ncbi:MAG: diacylglycerol kinase family protein [Bacteroidales bacterium]|nr:diacylglycerol kinase family protein [Bacteroidales bacterium]
MDKKSEHNKFSALKRLLSFKYAFRGIAYLIKTQHNAWIHLFAAIAVVLGGFYFSISQTEWIILVLTIGMVFMAEAINTAIELLVDKISPQYDDLAGRIKDIAAGAVLISAIAAAITGIIIFAPKIWN